MIGAGVGLVVSSLADMVVSTLSTTGGGPVSTPLLRGIWRSLLWLHRRRTSHGLLKRAAPVLIVLVIALWLSGLWAGWTLVFSAHTGAVVDATTEAPASFGDRVYFTGFSLFTLGTGDVVGGHAGWRIASTLCSFTGLFVVTLSLTYVMSVISAATEKRQIALLVHGVGADGVSLLRSAWDGRDLSGLDDLLTEVGPKLALHAERHLAYPVLHFFHAAERRAALAPAVVAVDDALRIAGALSPEVRPGAVATRMARAAIEALTERAGVDDGGAPPPIPDITKLREMGLPLAAPEVEAAFSDRARARLGSYLCSQGWPREAT